MTRSPFFDPLRDSNFWLYDVAPIELAASLPIFTPLMGFSAVSSPEITVETQQINEGNWPYTKSVVKSASVGSMTLSRGVSMVQSDFWRWVQSAVQGSTGSNIGFLPVGGVTYRRTLLLIHFFRNLPLPVSGFSFKDRPILAAKDALGQAGLAIGGNAFVSTAAGFVAGTDVPLQGLGVAASSAVQLGALQAMGAFFGGSAGSGNALGIANIGIKVPARAFMLKNCIPTRYKSGSDFDASSGQVSIQELDIQPEIVEEIALSA